MKIFIFTDENSLFSLVRNPKESSAELDRDLGRVAGWAYQWKMPFNLDPCKQVVEVHFSLKD